MPAQMYFMAVIGTVVAAYFFKEFVYEPHIAPNVERWAEQFIAHRQARRRQREVPLAVPVRSDGSSRSNGGDGDRSSSSIELESLPSGTREVDVWRSKVNRSQPSLRHRKAGAVDSPLLHDITSPTHVIFDPSSPTTPTSEGSIPYGSPPRINARSSSSSTLRSPVLPSVTLPAPEPSLRPLSPGVLNDASIIASYEVAQAPDSPQANLDLDSLSNSPFSSPPQSPFSTFSAMGAPSHQGIIFEAPVSEMDLSDLDGSFIIHSASNASVGGSIVGDDFDVQSEASSTSSWGSA